MCGCWSRGPRLKGDFFGRVCTAAPFFSDPLTAEAFALCWAVLKDQDASFSRIQVEGSLSVIKAARDGNGTVSYMNSLLSNARRLLADCNEWKAFLL